MPGSDAESGPFSPGPRERPLSSCTRAGPISNTILSIRNIIGRLERTVLACTKPKDDFNTFTQLGIGLVNPIDLLAVDLNDPQRKTLLARAHEAVQTLDRSTDGRGPRHGGPEHPIQ
jgi:hypothetical protein